MKALVYNGPREVRVKNVPNAKIERPTDLLVKITSTDICGSDLHMYEGRTDMEEAESSATRISARSWRWAKPWPGLKWVTGFVCLLMLPADFVRIVRRG